MNNNTNQNLQRYTANERSNHWAVALLFILAGLSGMALFHPALFWLSNLFGGGTWTRILHPLYWCGNVDHVRLDGAAFCRAQSD